VCESVSDSAAEFGVLEIVPESATDHVNGTLAVVWSDQWSHIIDHALSVVVEVSKALLDTLKLDCEWN
jgi:alcohol dehydrogenase YqhD (iron-dependent ADH family)